jgi:hypothetical protein
MNLNRGYTIVTFNYQTTWSQLVTPIAQNKNNMLPTSTYPMWCNVIPPFMHVNPSLYLVYPTGTKGLDSSNFKNCTSYVFGYVYPIPK